MNAMMIQSLLAKVYPGLVVDGIYGPNTAAALSASPKELYPYVAIYDPPFNDNLSNLAKEISMKPSNDAIINVISMIGQAAQELGVPLTWMLGFAKIESNYDPQATNGGSKGLFQMQKAAWADASKIVDLPDYDSSWQDPLQNARAAAGYLRISQKSLEKKGIDSRDPRHLYLAHQQGVSGLSELVQAANSGIEPVKSVIRDSALLGNKAPGTSKTVSRIDFYNNWMNYLSKFF